MLNTRELEKRWLHYKIKSYIPYAVITVSIFTIILITLFFLPVIQKEKEKTFTQKKQKTLYKEEIPKKEKTAQKNINTAKIIDEQKIKPAEKITKTSQITLQPSMQFIKHMQNEDQQPYYQTLYKTPTIHKKESTKRTKVMQQNNKIKEEYLTITQTQEQPKKIQPKSIITIEKKNSKEDIKEVLSRFKKNNNPALSLFIAKKEYELGNYEQAYNYALITNGINNDIEDSWIIFAKSLVKLHKRDMAIKTLIEYIKYSHSGNAKILLNEIQSGKFK
ncbi:Transformation system protein [hydrothermal vent metagenome]|uniref:Transformation system protein n=1 Tax=hydrothermal vent metagenome TaxID=652676 RepID=A0A1W1CRN0_9ZZZZ